MALHAMAKTYGCRPSDWFAGLNELERFGLDLTVLEAGAKHEEFQHKKAENLARAKARSRGGYRG